MNEKNASFSLKSIYGILLQTFSVIIFTIMVSILRYLYKTTSFSPVEVLVWRSSVLSVLNLGLANVSSIDIIAVKRDVSRVVFFRSLVGVCAVTGYFTSNLVVPPSIASAIFKLNPLLTSVIALIALKERISKMEVIGIVVAFGGVLLIIFDPSKVTFSLSDYLSQIYLFAIPLVTAILQSMAFVLVRMMGLSLHYLISPTFFGICGTIFPFPAVLGILSYRGYMTDYTVMNMTLVLLVGVLGWAAQIASSKALQIEKAARITAINFDTVLLLLVDVFYFGESISYVEILGMALVMVIVIGIAVLKAFNLVT